MPTLDWIGKKAVVNHHRQVPYRLLKCDAALSAGDADAGNLLVRGDNLLALKALLPYYAGKVKCIYIDPPYNTGNEGWVYNDNVNSPEIRRWLGKVIGKDAEDLSRHDKWLCMMYPRLALLRDFLTEDGAIFVSIDDNEVQNLRGVMDEVFGARNFVATIIWQKNYAPKASAKHFSEDHDYIVVYAKFADTWGPHLMPRTEKQDTMYKNRDDDPRGPWRPNNLAARNYYSKGTYRIQCPGGRVIEGPPRGSYWRVSEETFKELDKDNRIWWGKDRNSVPAPKIFLSEVKQGVVPMTIWPYTEAGHTQDAKKEVVSLVDFGDSDEVFITPKPTRLLERVLTVGADKDSLILDSFAGSGTTGHAVLKANAADGGRRRFILVEMDETICREVTAQRLTRVIKGYGDTPGLGGGFRYCTLGEPLFNADGGIAECVSFADLARHVFFTETGVPIPKQPRKVSALLGVHAGKGVYLLYNGVLGDKSVKGGNVLTGSVLATLPPHDGPKVIYGAGCRLGAERLRREGVTFKQVPYEIKVT
ncbi:MAG: site-specific DNA-methyltransferase [Planctomycetes bacterium]|nr:site-specific DNA-methyltransferase [Planctomycetota bacterium]